MKDRSVAEAQEENGDFDGNRLTTGIPTLSRAVLLIRDEADIFTEFKKELLPDV